MQEIWKDIRDYEGLYQISSAGRIKNIKTNRMLKPVTQSNGYSKVCLTKNKIQKNKTIHRLVAETFIPNPKKLPCINHKDENKANNDINNLEWCTQKQNMKHSRLLHPTKYKQDKAVICLETKIIYTSLHQAEKQTGIDGRSISKVCKSIRHTAGGYHWKFV